MKKFIISVLCVSVFFIGLGGLVESTSARFKSDARALELVRLARVAIGGDSNINNVRSMTITGTAARTFKNANEEQIKGGNVEINLEFPGKFSKMVRIGNPGEDVDIQKQVDVVVVRKGSESAEFSKVDDGKKVTIVTDGDGKVLTENIQPADGKRKIIVRTKDGQTETITTEGEKPGVWTTTDDKNFKVEKDIKIVRAGETGEARHNEMLRTTLALLLTAPEGTEISYTFAGESTVDGTTCNVVEANANGSTFKLFLDKASNLPKMISYMAAPMKMFRMEKPASDNPSNEKEVRVFVRKMDASEQVEHQLKLSDFRSVGGLLLPHKWTESVGGETNETIDISGYEINPANIADKFKNEKVFIRTQKPQ